MADPLRECIEKLVTLAVAEGSDVFGAVVSKDQIQVMPFGTISNQAEAVINYLQLARTIADNMPLDSGKDTDTSKIQEAMDSIIEQHIKVEVM